MAAIFDEEMNVLSKVTDPNDYQGPGTGDLVTTARRAEMTGIRQQRSRQDLLEKQAVYAGHIRSVEKGEAEPDGPSGGLRGRVPSVRDHIVAAHLRDCRWARHSQQILAGLRKRMRRASGARALNNRRRHDRLDRGETGRFRYRDRASGEGHSSHHRRDLPPLASLELYSIAPC